MAVYPVCICPKCGQAFVNGEASCAYCGGGLIRTNYSSIYWSKIDDVAKSNIVKNIFIQMSNGSTQSSATYNSYDAPQNIQNLTSDNDSYSDEKVDSGIGSIIKLISTIILAVGVIGSLIIMSDTVSIGLGVLASVLLLGTVCYGIGEICTLLTKINYNIKNLRKN